MNIHTRTNPEQLIIRPPSEWRSTHIRITRGCNWNRCRFCGIYPHLGESQYSERSYDEIANDIALLKSRTPHAEEFFLGDADPLNAGYDLTIRVMSLLNRTFPVNKITCYARASTLKKIGVDALNLLSRHGLTKIHLGLESGDAEILNLQRKGQSPKMFVTVSKWLRASGIEQSFYVLLGLGGTTLWRQHMLGTADIINRTEPEFVRIRRLWLYDSNPATGQPGCPLMQQVRDGNFIPQSPEGSVRELSLLLDNLKPSDTFLTCDHANNLLQVHGNLKDDLNLMRREVNSFLNLPEDQRKAHYATHQSSI